MLIEGKLVDASDQPRNTMNIHYLTAESQSWRAESEKQGLEKGWTFMEELIRTEVCQGDTAFTVNVHQASQQEGDKGQGHNQRTALDSIC